MSFLRPKNIALAVLSVSVILSLGWALQRGYIGKTSAPEAATVVSASQAKNVIELALTDEVIAQKLSMTQGLPVSGTLKAVRSAMVKARVAGELMALEVREGDAVKVGQILARVDPTEYTARQSQAQQQAQAAQAQVEVAQRQFDNNNALVNQGFISKTALDTSLANLNGAKATYQAALSALDVARKAVDDTTLKAPLSGWVSQRLAQPGERVSPDARILEIVDLSQLELEATLTSADAMLVKLGQTATLRVDGSGQEVSAKVLRINPSTQVGSRSVLVYLGLQAHPSLRQGVFVQGSLGTLSVQAIVLPLESVRTDKPEPYVQTIQNNAVMHVKVSTGIRGEIAGRAMIAVSSVPEGMKVLAPSAGSVREGTQVKYTTSVR